MKKSKRTISRSTVYRNILLIVLLGSIGGVFGFGVLAWIANIINSNSGGYDPKWMIYMLPIMWIIAVPFIVLVSKSIYKHLNVISTSIRNVIDGKASAYIDTTKSSMFNEVYENFNKMVCEIETVQQMSSEMVDGFSHEIKTPVANISGFAKMLKDTSLSQDIRAEYIDIIIYESDRLAQLAHNALTLSKLSASEIVLHNERYKVGKQIRDIVIGLENEWGNKDINIDANLDDVEYVGNKNLIDSIITNLLTNAIKFTPRGGDIAIRLAGDDNSMTLSVEDTGIGMNDETKARMFDRYFQGDNSHAIGGHGLGLAIVKRIVTMCCGDIVVESVEGEGSKIVVTLPNNI